ncbi:hypothetical protein GALL_60580 [mine drainage metagenome]|uniref:ATP-grasp domain-containing protein n=1 Tax=mine drainage metagenome TaxID=410659 RepID=A0A1J5SV54_9ZZZZ
MGFSIQNQALLMKRMYFIPAAKQPAKFRLLMLMAVGDLAENAPLDCLLENSNVDLIFYYASVDEPLPADLPAHDAIFVAISDTVDSRPVLMVLEPLLAHWHKPVINAPQNIPNTERSTASALLQNVPGLLMPLTQQVARDTLEKIIRGEVLLQDVCAGCVFPIILRPVGSQAGRDLVRINSAQEISQYLAGVNDAAFFLSRFIDYSSADGLFRKFRVALIAGQPFASHMAISSNWMIHYLNAGMYEDAAKRAEEAAFMANFDAFVSRHRFALDAVYKQSKLDYICIDCAETQDGELLIFEIDHAMVVHAMDPEDTFPYKKAYMLKVKNAFEDFLLSLPGASKL